MNKLIRLAAPAIFLALTACSSQKERVDIIVENAIIYTMDSAMTIANAMVIHNGKFLEIGSQKVINSKYKADRRIDAGGMAVFPGFIDPHCHFRGYGLWLQQASLHDCKSFAEVIERIRIHDTAYSPDWLCGRGWDQNLWDIKEMPDNTQLDRLYPDKPVVLVRIDGHAALANTKALELAGFNPADFQEKEVLLINGKTSGLLLEKAADFMKNAIPKPSIDQEIKALMDAQRDCFSVGLTTVMDAGSNLDKILIADSLVNIGKLIIGLNVMINPGEKNLEFLKNAHYRNKNLKVASLKLYADGALGSRGACLLEEYSDDPGNFGIMIFSEDFYREQCKLAKELGLQVCTHAIGDSAVRTVIRIYKEFLEQGNNLRWRIEHAQIVNPDDIDDFGKYAIIPSVQAIHATSDMGWAEKRLGKERINHAYAYAQLLQQNAWLPNGSDFPIESINPVYGFYAAVSRRDIEGKPDEGFMINNALSREQAMKAMTIWAAKSMFLENEIGSIEAGKIADFVITDRDLMNCEILQIPHTQMKACFKNGIIVFESE